MSREEFVKRLKKGYELQLGVAAEFLREGFIVKVHPYQENRSDEFDLMVKVTDRSKWREIEVKGNGKFYTGLDDFPYENLFVETKRKFDSRVELPEYYVICSYKTNACICIHKSSSRHFGNLRTKDTQKNLYDDFVICPKEYAIPWDEMVERLVYGRNKR